VGLLALSDELIFRGVLQGALETDPASPLPPRARRWTAAAVGLALAWLAAPPALARAGFGSSPAALGVLLMGLAPALARGATGRVLAACAARLVLLVTF